MVIAMSITVLYDILRTASIPTVLLTHLITVYVYFFSSGKPKLETKCGLISQRKFERLLCVLIIVIVILVVLISFVGVVLLYDLHEIDFVKTARQCSVCPKCHACLAGFTGEHV